jgi:ethanolamine ammonia-lyase small subunit
VSAAGGRVDFEMSEDEKLSVAPAWTEILGKIRARTPARIFVEQGAAYSTRTGMELREAHANAVDAVWAEFNPDRDFTAEFVERWKLFQVASQARSKQEYLLRPDLGRKLREADRATILERCARGADFHVVIGDGLSVAAVTEQVPKLLPLLKEHAIGQGWSMGQSFVVRYCRVGAMNEIGELLRARVVVLLIGERPGLATAASLSAYMAYRPVAGNTDADRNLISNIHARGVGAEEAAARITVLAARMMDLERSGTMLKEDAVRRVGVRDGKENELRGDV